MNSPMKVQGQSRGAARLKLAREWHLYLGTLFAPSIIFFALTGVLQIFSLHEGRPGGTYQPPVWIQKLASIHKHQNIETHKQELPPGFGREQAEPQPGAGEQKEPPAAGEAEQASRPHASGRPGKSRPGKSGRAMIPTYLLKWFFVGTALGLVASTLLGIYMAFKFNRSRMLVWGLLFLGTAIPVALVVIMT